MLHVTPVQIFLLFQSPSVEKHFNGGGGGGSGGGGGGGVCVCVCARLVVATKIRNAHHPLRTLQGKTYISPRQNDT